MHLEREVKRVKHQWNESEDDFVRALPGSLSLQQWYEAASQLGVSVGSVRKRHWRLNEFAKANSPKMTVTEFAESLGIVESTLRRQRAVGKVKLPVEEMGTFNLIDPTLDAVSTVNGSPGRLSRPFQEWAAQDNVRILIRDPNYLLVKLYAKWWVRLTDWEKQFKKRILKKRGLLVDVNTVCNSDDAEECVPSFIDKLKNPSQVLYLREQQVVGVGVRELRVAFDDFVRLEPLARNIGNYVSCLDLANEIEGSMAFDAVTRTIANYRRLADRLTNSRVMIESRVGSPDDKNQIYFMTKLK